MLNQIPRERKELLWFQLCTVNSFKPLKKYCIYSKFHSNFLRSIIFRIKIEFFPENIALTTTYTQILLCKYSIWSSDWILVAIYCIWIQIWILSSKYYQLGRTQWPKLVFGLVLKNHGLYLLHFCFMNLYRLIPSLNSFWQILQNC